MRLSDIRAVFLNYFKKQGHEVFKSSPLVPENDPTLLFTNAGMVQFKDFFTGKQNSEFKKVATSQKCIRAGGKHNDLDNVGYTARHHTFFEMLGNFSFGDYFKEDAIYYAWNLITKDFAIDPKKLLVTVYSEDEEAFNLWKKIAGFSSDKIIKISSSDNFWSMGDTGPCGPCSEIFFDHGEKIFGGVPGSKDADGDRFVEIWNLVFMQFEQHIDGSKIALPKPSIDTGMGLERIAAVLQGVHNNYGTDLFKSIIDHSISLTGKTEPRQSHNVIADHLRSSAFLIADGVFPSNEGRGYVLRRIMRRAMRHAYKLGAQKPLMHLLAPTLIDLMGDAYPELKRAKDSITYTLEQEENHFRHTLERGLKILKNEIKGKDLLSGESAYKLYDTYGFPIDLTQDILREEGKVVDLKSYEVVLEENRQKDTWVEESFDKNIDWYSCENNFYVSDQGLELIAKITKVESNFEEGHNRFFLVTDKTPFYPEGGGQIGDQGFCFSKNCRAKILNTAKKRNSEPFLVVHEVEILEGHFELGDLITLKVDEDFRIKVSNNHSATHLLHSALRKVLGNHVSQKGSLVDDQRLRFDFVHHQALTSDEIMMVENLINEQINLAVQKNIKIISLDEAISSGAMALFGEKYADQVRVVKFGEFSTELCGGTHVENTKNIEKLKIVGESSVAFGIRRIEAITGLKNIENFESRKNLEEQKKLYEKNEKAKIVAENIAKKDLILKEAIESLKNGKHSKDIKNYKFVNFNFGHSVVESKDLKFFIDQVKNIFESCVVVTTTIVDNKVYFVVGITNNLTNKINAVDLVNLAKDVLEGKGGGGRSDLAQSGGIRVDKIEEAVNKVHSMLIGI